jgi:RNA polymerase sigma-70 factor (ECF subfamily)
MRDVLMWSAAEVAEALNTTAAAVNSALQRAHNRMDEMGLSADEVAEPLETASRLMVERYVTAFERADIAALTQLLTDDVVMEMPPIRNWFRGPENFGRFIARSYSMRGLDWRMIPTTANGQPAVTAYTRAADGEYRIHTLQVFTLRHDGICHLTVFQDDAVFAIFHLPATVPNR